MITDFVFVSTAPAAASAAYGLIDPAVISLRRRPERWQAAQRALAEYGIVHPQRFDAVDGQRVEREKIEAMVREPARLDAPLSDYLQLTRPALGCFLSHLTLWRRLIASGEPSMLVLEDDARPSPALSTRAYRAVVDALPASWDLLLLGATLIDGMAEPVNEHLDRIYYFNGTYAYLVSRSGALKLASRLLPIETHIDHQISRLLLRDRCELRAYRCRPALFDHDFAVWSDTYVPLDAALAPEADRELAALFRMAREGLVRDGVRLLSRTAR